MLAVERLRAHLADPLHRNGYLLLLNGVLGAGFGFLFWLVAARTWPPAALGAGAAVVSAFTLAALLGKFGLDAALVRWVPRTAPDARRRLLLLALVASGALAALAAAGVLLLAGGLPALGPLDTLLFVAFAAFTALGWVFDAYFAAERSSGRSVLRNLVFNVLKAGLPFAAFVRALELGLVVAWGAGVVASVAASAFLALPLLARPRAVEAAPPRPWEVWSYAARNYAVNVGEWLPTLALPLLVVALVGPEANARFYVAWTLASVGMFASRALAQSAFAELSHAPDRDAWRGIEARAARQQAIVLGPFALALVVLGGPLLALFGPGYADGHGLVLLLAASLAGVALLNLRLAALRARDRGWELVALPLVAPAVALALAAFLLPPFGPLGAAAAWLAASLAAGAWCLLAPLGGDVPDLVADRRRAHEG